MFSVVELVSRARNELDSIPGERQIEGKRAFSNPRILHLSLNLSVVSFLLGKMKRQWCFTQCHGTDLLNPLWEVPNTPRLLFHCCLVLCRPLISCLCF